MKDLVVIVADRDIEQAVATLLRRPQALGVRSIDSDVLVHPHRDPGCFTNVRALADGYERSHEYILVVFDRAWDGAPSRDPGVLEAKVIADLKSQWGDRCGCVVIDPEIEAWVFSDSPNVDRVLGWEGKEPTLRDWLVAEGFLARGSLKPSDPKRAFEAALFRAKRPNSSAIFRDLANAVSVERCIDPSFTRMKQTLRAWFPVHA